MSYTSDKHVVFSFMQRVDYNKTIEEIEFDLSYDFGDYNFGEGDSSELRQKIRNCIHFMKYQFDGTFNKGNNTSK